MNNKCRFCGYRFRDKDEQICPECFTAREEDISCGVFGEDEHSHYMTSRDLERESMLFSRNDTFKESRNEFLEDERRQENRSNAARYEKMEQKQAAKQQRANNTNSTNYNSSVLPQQTVYSRQQLDAARSALNNNGVNPNQQNPSCGKGCGCLIFLIILVISIVFSATGGDLNLSELFSKKDEKSSNSLSVVTEPMPDLSLPDISIPDVDSIPDINNYFREDNSIPEIQSEDGTYSIAIKDWTLAETGKDILNEDEGMRFMIYSDDPNSQTHVYSKDMGLDISRYNFTVELNSKDPENEKHSIFYIITFSEDTQEKMYYDFYTMADDIDDTTKPENTEAFDLREMQTIFCEGTEYKQLIIGVINGDNEEDVEEFVFGVDDYGVFA